MDIFVLYSAMEWNWLITRGIQPNIIKSELPKASEDMKQFDLLKTKALSREPVCCNLQDLPITGRWRIRLAQVENQVFDPIWKIKQ